MLLAHAELSTCCVDGFVYEMLEAASTLNVEKNKNTKMNKGKKIIFISLSK